MKDCFPVNRDPSCVTRPFLRRSVKQIGKFRFQPRKLFALSMIAVALSACGGGGGGGGSAAAPVALPTFDTLAVARTASASALSAGWQDGVFMEIFVRAYQDSDGDGIGDIKGLTQKLDYLKALGVTGLWLMPVNPSQDRHSRRKDDHASANSMPRPAQQAQR